MRRAPWLLAIVCAAIIAAIIAGLVIVGGPAEARRERMDRLRFEDFQNITLSIGGYVQSRGYELPETLAGVYDETEGDMAPVDPETGQPYEYVRLSATRFQLCATFTSSGAQDLERRKRIMVFLRFTPDIRGPGRNCVAYGLAAEEFKPLPPAPPRPARP